MEAALQDVARDSPTGLRREELAGLDESALSALAAWHRGKAGDDEGKPWWPQAVRRMPLGARLAQASDPLLDAAWQRREQGRVRTSPAYFTESYGHVQPEEGAPLPFVFWPRQEAAQGTAIGARDQREVVEAFERELRVIILKARQLGLTWLAVHYAVWVLAFDPRNPRAKVLGLSKHGGDATKLLARARRVLSLLPAFLRPEEDRETVRSLQRMKLAGRGEFISLAGSPEAARGETATLALVDEFAHIKNGNAGPTWSALTPTLGRRGRAFVIFTGNGPANQPGDGQAAAALWERARESAEDGMYPIFLPTSTHPDRDRDEVRDEFLTEEEWHAEYPETEEEALEGAAGLKVYSAAGISAAVRLGRELDEHPPPLPDGLETAWDWGELTAGLAIWPLEGGGLYVTAEEAPQRPQEVRVSAENLILKGLAPIQRTVEGRRGYWPPVVRSTYDEAGKQSMRSFVAVAQDPAHVERFVYRVVAGRKRVRTVPIPFNAYKDEGKDYLRRLFRRTQQGHAVQVIAISPRCKILIPQLRGLELVEGTDRIKKGNDHGPDALIAAAAPRAAVYGRRAEPEEEQLDD